MGALRSKFNHSGLIVNGITLGQPLILTEDLTQPQAIAEAFFVWDDAMLPSGEILENGNVIADL